MSAHKNKSHLELIKDEIDKTHYLNEDEKSLTMKQLDEWILEDKAAGTFYNELIDIAKGVKPMLAELGLL